VVAVEVELNAPVLSLDFLLLQTQVVEVEVAEHQFQHQEQVAQES
jgi:hypothetical protein